MHCCISTERAATLEPSVNLMYFTFCRFYRESVTLQYTITCSKLRTLHWKTSHSTSCLVTVYFIPSPLFYIDSVLCFCVTFLLKSLLCDTLSIFRSSSVILTDDIRIIIMCKQMLWCFLSSSILLMIWWAVVCFVIVFLFSLFLATHFPHPHAHCALLINAHSVSNHAHMLYMIDQRPVAISALYLSIHSVLMWCFIYTLQVPSFL